MIHVDVRKVSVTGDYVVQTSVDGGCWSTQYMLGNTVGDTESDVKLRAEQCARVFISGCKFAGAEARGTSCGYAL
jgi:hypothetical protein